MKTKITVSVEPYEEIWTEEEIEEFIYNGKSFEECFKDNFEMWRLEPVFKFEIINE